MEPSRSAHYAPISKRQVYGRSPSTGRIPLSSRHARLHYDRPLLGNALASRWADQVSVHLLVGVHGELHMLKPLAFLCLDRAIP